MSPVINSDTKSPVSASCPHFLVNTLQSHGDYVRPRAQRIAFTRLDRFDPSLVRERCSQGILGLAEVPAHVKKHPRSMVSSSWTLHKCDYAPHRARRSPGAIFDAQGVPVVQEIGQGIRLRRPRRTDDFVHTQRQLRLAQSRARDLAGVRRARSSQSGRDEWNRCQHGLLLLDPISPPRRRSGPGNSRSCSGRACRRRRTDRCADWRRSSSGGGRASPDRRSRSSCGRGRRNR